MNDNVRVILTKLLDEPVKYPWLMVRQDDKANLHVSESLIGVNFIG